MTKFRLYLALCLWAIGGHISGQFNLGEAAGYANAGLTLSSLWSAQYNQAGLGQIENIQVGIAYKMPFLVTETATQSFVIAMPVSNGSFALSLNSFGYSLFREGKYGLAYGRKLGEDFNAGMQLNFESIYIGENYGSASTITIEGGIQYRLSKNLSLAAHLLNPNRSTYKGIEKSESTSVMKGAFRYTFSNKAFLTGEVWKDSFNTAQTLIGLEFQPAEKLKMRAGVSTHPTQVSFGIGLILNDFFIDLASEYHQELGVTPNISLRYAK